MNVIGIFLLAILATSLQVSAEDKVYEFTKEPGTEKMIKGDEAANRKDSQVKNNFYSRLVITDDNTVFKRWNLPSEKFSLKKMTKVEKGTYFFPLIIFAGPKRKNKKAKVSYILRISKPDGSIYFENMFTAWEGNLPKNGMHLSSNYVKVSMDPEGQFGVYKVQAFVRDELGMSDLALSAEFELVPSLEKKDVSMTDEEVNKIMTYFYRDKQFKKIPTLIKKLSLTPGFLDRKSSLKYFFSEVFTSYPEVISNSLKTVKEDNAFYNFILDSVWYSNTPESTLFLQNLLESTKVKKRRVYIEGLLGKQPVSLQELKISSAGDLDKLWAAYFASGKRDFLEVIIQSLTSPESNKRQAWKVYASAKWSTLSNCEQHPKVLSDLINISKVKSDALKPYKKSLTDIIKTCKGSKS